MTDTVNPAYGQIDQAYATRLATTPPERRRAGVDGQPHEVPRPGGLQRRPGHRHQRPGGRRPLHARSSRCAAIGAEIVFAADVDEQLLGDAPVWDRVGVVQYPTRRSFIDMQSRDDFQAKHVHKVGRHGADDRDRLPTVRGPAGAPGRRPRPEWSDVPHPPTADDRSGRRPARHPLRRRRAPSDDARRDAGLPVSSGQGGRGPRACASRAGSRSKAPSSATVARGIRCGSTPSPARRRSWRWCIDPARLAGPTRPSRGRPSPTRTR